MRKLITSILVLVCILCLTACANKTFERTETIEGNFKTYYKLSDGTWECDGHAYKYRLEFNGTMPNASVSSSFVYLSNIEDISFEQAYKAAGVSSNLNDYFDIEDAVLVEMATVEEIAPAQIAQIGNPWTTWSSIEEAENVVNFEFGLPEVVAERYVAEEIQTMNNELIEVVYLVITTNMKFVIKKNSVELALFPTTILTIMQSSKLLAIMDILGHS